MRNMTHTYRRTDGGDDGAGSDIARRYKPRAVTFDATVAHPARIYDYRLGGKDNFAADLGIRQFLDIGTGLPTANNTHQVAQRAAPESR